MKFLINNIQKTKQGYEVEILEYLEEITKDKQQSRLNSMLWMGRSKIIARIFAGIMFIMAVICIILSAFVQ